MVEEQPGDLLWLLDIGQVGGPGDHLEAGLGDRGDDRLSPGRRGGQVVSPGDDQRRGRDGGEPGPKVRAMAWKIVISTGAIIAAGGADVKS